MGIKTASNNKDRVNSLNCFFVNARGLIPKMDILREYVIDLKLDIIGVAETFLNNEVLNAEIHIEGYKMFRKDRCSVKEGKCGGVILYIKEDIVSYEYYELSSSKSESIWVKIKVDNKSELVVGTCYKSPSSDSLELKELYDTIAQAANKEVLIMGDFNFPYINWDTLESDSDGSHFRDLLLDNYLIQHVKEPTRNNNVLDLVITSDVNMVDKMQVLEHLGNSDHNIIIWKLICNVEAVDNKIHLRQYNNANYDEMRNFFAEVDWGNELQGQDVDDMWGKFSSIIHTAIDKFVPVACKKKKKFPIWMNKVSKSARKYKSKMWYRYRQSKTYNDLVEYKRAQNKAVREYRNAKKLFEKRLTKNIKNNPKSFYSYCRSKMKTKDVVGPLKNKEGEYVTDNAEMSNILNEFFGSVFTDENILKQLPEVKSNFIEDNNHMLRTVSLTRECVLTKLLKLKINKAPGVDDIVPRILVENAYALSEPLLYIYRISLETGKVPAEWKKANVTAIFKKGERECPGNYRPVSLTSHVCKVLETILKDNIVSHLNRFQLINGTQHGFIKQRSCLTNLLEYLEFVTNYVDQGYPIDVIYLDFQKAFDKVPHRRLMLKINAMGIIGDVSNWIENWLKDRYQRVVLLGNCSRWIKVRSGVPQGSVLGPLLFLIYINDIDECVNSKLLKFADDTKIFSVVASQNDVDKLRDDLENLCKWSNEWLMLFNIDKCKVMHIGYNNAQADYVMEGNTLNVVTEERDLGILVQNNMKWDQQCSKSVKMANRILGMIKRNFDYLDGDMVLQLYKSLVRPHLEYCVQAWRPHLQKDIDLLERVQRRATKLVPKLKYKTYEERLSCLGLTSLETRRLRGDLIEVFKILKGFDDVDFQNFFALSNTSTRGHSLKLFKYGCRLDCRKYAFSNRIVNTWNELEEDIIACDSINSFKNRLDKYLKGRGFI